ncbi:MAG TPA: bifunctional DNA-formamidopyrimidine glycosylase/DNA-(apurinic or apyrimidinic site) lyase [Solirubrobacterales bacterium]|nr:bifunctional DNA-formamidopyrimidine glycosylase/DNA-(apurinic or apyrimidinic site) lyase [Solirubrobacterales bacterium]
MPELPEVETIRRQLAERVAGRTIVDAQVLDPLWTAPVAPAEVETALRGRAVERLRRRGKYLIADLDEDRYLVMHLRMTGNLLWVAAGDDGADRAHLRVRLVLDDGNRLVFTDQRRFGTGVVIDGRELLERYLDARLGPEPLDPGFTPDVLRAAAHGRRAPVKAFLLDQRRVAGIGNIYADEALFRAGIHPLKPVGRLRRADFERLHAGIVAALEKGLAHQGASIDDYRDANGEQGSMQNEFLIHLRAGQPCPRCGGPVTKLVAAGRGTYVCRNCQRAPRRRRVPAP